MEDIASLLTNHPSFSSDDVIGPGEKGGSVRLPNTPAELYLSKVGRAPTMLGNNHSSESPLFTYLSSESPALKPPEDTNLDVNIDGMDGDGSLGENGNDSNVIGALDDHNDPFGDDNNEQEQEALQSSGINAGVDRGNNDEESDEEEDFEEALSLSLNLNTLLHLPKKEHQEMDDATLADRVNYLVEKYKV